MTLSDDIASDIEEVEDLDEAFVSVTHTTTSGIITLNVPIAPLNMSSDTLFESKKDYVNKRLTMTSFKSTIIVKERELIAYDGIVFTIDVITSEDQYSQTYDIVYKKTLKAHGGS